MTIYFGENIKKLRKEKDITQETLAGFLGVSFQAVSKWERGETYPDITMLPAISSFFGVTIDELIGTDKARNDQKIQAYLSIYESIKLKDAPPIFSEFQKAAKEFPGDFRILIRYMELLESEKGTVRDPDFEKTSQELMSIYKNIQKYCTDDDIRIWAKRIIIKHLMVKFDCTCDENGKYGVFTEYSKQAEAIISTLPSMKDSKEYVSLLWSRKEPGNSFAAIEELLYMFSDAFLVRYLYNNDFTKEYKIEFLELLLKLFNLIYTDGDYGKNCWWRLWNYGHLGRLYHQVNNNEKSLKSLRIAAEYAAELDKNPDRSEHAAWFYGLGPDTIYRKTTACQFMKEVMTKHYPLSEEFKSKPEFKEIISLMEKADDNTQLKE